MTQGVQQKNGSHDGGRPQFIELGDEINFGGNPEHTNVLNSKLLSGCSRSPPQICARRELGTEASFSGQTRRADRAPGVSPPAALSNEIAISSGKSTSEASVNQVRSTRPANTYPTPRTVWMTRGKLVSRSSLRRNRRIWTSILRSKTSSWTRVACRRCSRLRGR
jgi:hypothetical protein